MDTGKGMLSNALSSVQGPQRTDLPVLLPVAARVRRAAFIERREGTYRLNMQRHHIVWVAVLVYGMHKWEKSMKIPGYG